jgi:hypothetical protein
MHDTVVAVAAIRLPPTLLRSDSPLVLSTRTSPMQALFSATSADFFARVALGLGETRHSAALREGEVGRKGISHERTFRCVLLGWVAWEFKMQRWLRQSLPMLMAGPVQSHPNPSCPRVFLPSCWQASERTC